MASCVLLFWIFFFSCCYGHATSFVEVVCEKTITGQVAHQSVLTCKVETTQDIPDLTILMVVWKKKGDDQFLSVLEKKAGKEIKFQPGYEVVLNNRTVSLVITDTKVKDEGVYTCQVTTDSGTAIKSTYLKVTAKYHPPTVNSSDEKEIPNAHKTLICKATGGYPKGELRWFDENKTEWTKSATPGENQMEDGLFELSSKLPLLKGSTSNEYTCKVFNASGREDGSAIITTGNGSPDFSNQEPSKTSVILAPVLVIGSLIVGLLLLLLICRRRSQKKNRRPSTVPLMGAHAMVPHSDPEIDPPPPYCEETEASMA